MGGPSSLDESLKDQLETNEREFYLGDSNNKVQSS